MAQVTQIIAEITTGKRPDEGTDGASTDGDVYLGIGGREFYIDSKFDDFEGGFQKFILGSTSTPTDLTLREDLQLHNDPRGDYPLTDKDINDFPVYIRYEPGGDWNLERVKVTAKEFNQTLATFSNLIDSSDGRVKKHLWLGEKYGKYCYLRRI